MARTLEVARRPDSDTDVEVSIRSETERDIGVAHDAQDLILMVARVMGWSVSVDQTGGAAIDPGVADA